jgi:AAA+ ATPase superfamily predicted ATPase
MDWGFYGRLTELQTLAEIFGRNRWFFAKLTGRRRIGKTTLIHRALQATPNRPVFYVQIPDSGAAGVFSAIADAMDSFAVPADRFPRPREFVDLAGVIGAMARQGYTIVLDEFQYFNRKKLRPFCSFLQAEVDTLASNAGQVRGGLLVLGSIHTEMKALLEDRTAPLFNRVTDEIELGHLDFASLKAMLQEHADLAPERLLFLWTLFEGVPKFYRDCYEQRVLDQDRQTLVRRIFFESSSPLRTEAENWFLKEMRGQYDVVLKFVARHAGCLHNELVGQIEQASGETSHQVGGYLKVLCDRYRLIEKKQPIFSAKRARRTRYYLTDNFLRAWLAALASSVAAINFRPVEQLVADADQRMHEVEGKAFEKMVGILYEERSRKGIGDFPLTRKIEGYWDSSDTELDLVAINEPARRIRFGSCKRSASQLVGDLPVLNGHIARFLGHFPGFRGWQVEKVSLAPHVSDDVRNAITAHGNLAQDINDLLQGLDAIAR